MKSFIIALFLSSVQLVSAQPHTIGTDVGEFNELFAEKDNRFQSKWSLTEPKNDIQLSVYTLFFVYKEFFSSQDNSVCNFYPSCSVYAIHTVQQKGALIGFMSAFDRLLRCNGLNADDYKIHPDTRLLYDPVE